MRVEVGRALAAEADLLCRGAEQVCERLQTEWGPLLAPPVFLEAPWLRPQEYRILFGDRESGGRAWPGRLQVLGEPHMLKGLAGRRDVEALFGQPCVWIPRRECPVAQAIGLSVNDFAEVLCGHLERALRQHLAREAAWERVDGQLAELERTHPSLVVRVLRRVGREHLQRVLYNLAADGVVPGDLRLVLERLAGLLGRPGSPEAFTERLRVEFREALCRPLARGGKLSCLTLDADYQGWLFAWLRRGADRRTGERWLAHLARALRDASGRPELGGERPALVCLPGLRPALARLLSLPLPELRVLKASELDPALQVLERQRLQAPGWQVRAGRWLGWLALKAEDRQQLRAEQEEYERCLKRRSLPLRAALESSAPPAPRRPRPAPPSGRRSALTPLQKAAVLLLECPTWVLREVLSRLHPAEISRLGREMTRMGRESPILREQVLKDLPGGARAPVEIGQLMAHLRRLLDEAARPETALSEIGLCLTALPDPTYQAVAARLFSWMGLAAAEDLRGEVASLRGTSNPLRAGRAVERFVRFYRGAAGPLSLYGDEQVARDLHRAALRNPGALALALERLWLRPENHRLGTFAEWAAAHPARSAHWLLRWHRGWTPPRSEPELCARAILDSLPHELAAEVRRHLDPELRHMPRGPVQEEAVDLARTWLSEYYLLAWPDCPAAELSLN